MEDTTNFHEVVDADLKEQEMYDDIRSIPSDDETMISSIIAVVQKHVTEVWSQPRATAMAHKYNLVPGAAYDIETNDDTGSPWDFDIPEQRNKCVREILEQRPFFLIGSPMCTAFSILQGLNKARMDPGTCDITYI